MHFGGIKAAKAQRCRENPASPTPHCTEFISDAPQVTNNKAKLKLMTSLCPTSDFHTLQYTSRRSPRCYNLRLRLASSADPASEGP